MRTVLALSSLLLLSGCSTPFQSEERSLTLRDSSHELPGVNVSFEFQWHRHAPGAFELHVLATATNSGANDYLQGSGCGAPWAFWLERNDTRFPHKDPGPPCEPGPFEPFRSGARLGTRFDWDRTEWNQTSGRQETSPAGPYAVFGVFVFHDASGQRDVVAGSYPFEVPA